MEEKEAWEYITTPEERESSKQLLLDHVHYIENKSTWWKRLKYRIKVCIKALKQYNYPLKSKINSIFRAT